MAAGAKNITGMIMPVGLRADARRSSSVAGITLEFYFHKAIDNSRVVKLADPKRRREIRLFSASVAALFVVMMFYAWQHLRAIEYGYRIEAQKSERERLIEQSRALKLEEASLRDPVRIDAIARTYGLGSPQPGQVIYMDAAASGPPVVAQVSAVTVIPAQ